MEEQKSSAFGMDRSRLGAFGKIEANRINEWRQLTPEQVSDLVARDSPVALWLNRRMGWKKLLQACLPEQTRQHFEALDREDRRAA